MLVDNVIIDRYLLVISVVGVGRGCRLKNLEYFPVTGRSYGAGVIFAILIGGGFSTGNAEKAALFGIADIVAL